MPSTSEVCPFCLMSGPRLTHTHTQTLRVHCVIYRVIDSFSVSRRIWWRMDSELSPRESSNKCINKSLIHSFIGTLLSSVGVGVRSIFRVILTPLATHSVLSNPVLLKPGIVGKFQEFPAERRTGRTFTVCFLCRPSVHKKSSSRPILCSFLWSYGPMGLYPPCLP